MLVKPLTFMNRSGEAVISWLNYVKAGHEDLLVVCDDFSLETGVLRFRQSGSDGGHNGLKSIIECLGSGAFPRLRIGIGNPAPFTGGKPFDLADYVLEDFGRQERKLVDAAVETSAAAVGEYISKGIDFVMNAYNRKQGGEQ